MTKALVVVEQVRQAIRRFRGQRVVLDADLAALYGVDVRTLKQAVKRNLARFPADFMFQLTVEEAASLRSQVVILKKGRGRHAKYLPYAFTEQGVAMLSSVLHSPRALQVNIEIMRAFVRLRQLITASSELARKLAAPELKCDASFKSVFRTLDALVATEVTPRRRIGFTAEPAGEEDSLRSQSVILKNRPKAPARRLSR